MATGKDFLIVSKNSNKDIWLWHDVLYRELHFLKHWGDFVTGQATGDRASFENPYSIL